MQTQIAMFPEMQSEIFPSMPLVEMRKHEWVVAWSGGKDSTTTIIKMHELGVPIKYIVFVLMMWDENTPAILPEMYDFVLKAKEAFEQWGYKVLIVKSPKFAKDHGIDLDGEMTVAEFVELTKNAYGGEVIKMLEEQK